MFKKITFVSVLGLILNLAFFPAPAHAQTIVHSAYEELNVNGTAYHSLITVNPTDNIALNWTVEGGDTAQTVLIDIELRNNDGQIVAQKFWDNVTFDPAATQNFSLPAPTGLPEGFYGYSLGIFTPGWQQNLLWERDQEAFNMSAGSPLPTPPPPPPSPTPAPAPTSTPTTTLSDIVLDHNELSSSIPAGELGHTVVSFIHNIGDADRAVLVDMEIWDANHNKVAQQFLDNSLVPAGQTQIFSFPIPGTLPPGAYFVQIGIFDPGWSSLVHWYADHDTFTVVGNASAVAADAVLGSSNESSANLSVGATNNLTAYISNPGSSPITVLVDLEIYDQNGNKIAQTFTDNVSIAAASTNSFSLTTPILSAGNYRLVVGIFTPGWSSLLHWYNSPQTFSVQ